jgi:PAS domain S-box-containing protein
MTAGLPASFWTPLGFCLKAFLFEKKRSGGKHMCPILKRIRGYPDIQGILLVSLLLISCAYATLETLQLLNIPFSQSKALIILMMMAGVTATSVLIRKYSELRQHPKINEQKRRTGISNLNKKLGDANNIDADDSIATDMAPASHKGWGKTFNSIHDWVCLMDLDSVILQTNRAGEKYVGVSTKEMIGRNCCSLVHGTDARPAECPLPKMLKTGERESIELPIVNGRWMLITVDPLTDAGGNIIRAIHITRDISNRKREEMEKVKREILSRQIQKADSLGRMAGAIAHHFNNQLMIVMGNLELAIADLSQGKKLLEYLTAAMRAAERAAKMSGLMLTYLGQTADMQEPLDLSGICRQSLSLLRAVIPDPWALETDLPSPGPVIKGNKNQLQQALTNMVHNAWESRDGPGTIFVGVKSVSAGRIPAAQRFPVDWQPAGMTYAELEVRDTGCGIIESDIERIFDPFFSTKFPGRGLGLPVVLGIVKAHGGGLAVESEPGRGSRFRIFLPVAAEKVFTRTDGATQLDRRTNS